MTEEQYKDGLLTLLEVLQDIESAESWEEVDILVDYGMTLVEEGIDKLTNKKVIH